MKKLAIIVLLAHLGSVVAMDSFRHEKENGSFRFANDVALAGWMIKHAFSIPGDEAREKAKQEHREQKLSSDRYANRPNCRAKRCLFPD